MAYKEELRSKKPMVSNAHSPVPSNKQGEHGAANAHAWCIQGTGCKPRMKMAPQSLTSKQPYSSRLSFHQRCGQKLQQLLHACG